MSTKRKDKAQPYGLTNEVIDGLLNRSASYDEVFGEGGLYRSLTKRLFERMLETELTQHLGYEKHRKPPEEFILASGGNSRNGTSSKTVSSSQGDIRLDIVRDRRGTFAPKIIPKGATRLPEIEPTIIALYGGGMSSRDIAEELYRCYGIEASPTFISEVTDSINEDVRQWRNRPLEEMYMVMFCDGFHLKVRQDGKVITKCLYVVMAVDRNGHKHCLGIWIAQTESASFWLGVFTELRNRGLNDVLIATTDGLTGFGEALAAAFPKCVHQTCIVHLLRNSTAIVALKDRRAIAADLKQVYTAATEEEAARMLGEFEAKWNAKYTAVARSWRNNWHKVVPMFAFMPELRRLIYTTNPIESINRGLRKAVKTRTNLPQ